MAKIANVALTNTFNTWRVNSNQAFDRLSQFAINNSSLYANTVVANNLFRSSGNTVLGAAGKRAIVTGLLSANGRVTVGTNLAVSGNTSTNKLTVTSSFTSSGNTALGDGVADITTITGSTSISTNLTVSGNTTLGAAGKTITTTGAASHTGTTSISTNLTVSGNTTLGAAGKTITTTGAASHTGTTSISTNLTVSGNTNINTSGSNGVFSNTASFGIFSNNINFSSKKIRNFTEDAMSYRASSTSITLSGVRNVQRISLTGNATVTLPAGMPGKTESIKTIVVIFKQDATGSRTMAFAAPAGETLLFNNSATLPAVSSAANKVSIYVCTKLDGDTRWYISQSFIEA